MWAAALCHRELEQIAAGRASKYASINPAKPGTHYERGWKGLTYQVEVSYEGFKIDGRTWPSLVAVAKHITDVSSD